MLAAGVACERSKAQYLQNLASEMTGFWQLGQVGLIDAAQEGQKIASASTAVEHLGQVSGIATSTLVTQVLGIRKTPNVGLQLRRAISIQAAKKKVT